MLQSGSFVSAELHKWRNYKSGGHFSMEALVDQKSKLHDGIKTESVEKRQHLRRCIKAFKILVAFKS